MQAPLTLCVHPLAAAVEHQGLKQDPSHRSSWDQWLCTCRLGSGSLLQEGCILAPASRYSGDLVDYRQDYSHFCLHRKALLHNRFHNNVLGWGHTRIQAQVEVQVVEYMHSLYQAELKKVDMAQRHELAECHSRGALGNTSALRKGQPCNEGWVELTSLAR